MPLMIGINVGFVTNSSSMVHHFPRELLDHPKVKAFLQAFELQGGFVGSDLWNRGACETIAMTKEQKREVSQKLTETDYGQGPGISTEDDSIVIIYGDEHPGIAASLSHVLEEVGRGLGMNFSGDEYN